MVLQPGHGVNAAGSSDVQPAHTVAPRRRPWPRPEQARPYAQGLAQYLLLDLARLRSVERFVQQVQAVRRPIDCLVLNAGVAYYPHTLTEDGFELQVGARAA